MKAASLHCAEAVIISHESFHRQQDRTSSPWGPVKVSSGCMMGKGEVGCTHV